MRGLLLCAGLIVSSAFSYGASAPHLPAASPAYRIKLDRLVVAPNQVAGLLVKGRINGGPPLRLLVDSGTQFVVLNRASAARSGCTGGTDLDLVGAGAGSPAIAKELRASLELGDLTLHGVPLLISDRRLAQGIQGVLPLSIFRGFLVRLDIPGKVLDLLPYPTEIDRAGTISITASNQLLFVKGMVNEKHEGNFLLDTGATYTAISQNLARELHISDAMFARVALQGGTAAIDAPLVSGAVRLQFAGRRAAPAVAVDLSTASRYHNFEVSGLIGYTALCDSVLTVNYRDGLLRIEGK